MSTQPAVLEGISSETTVTFDMSPVRRLDIGAGQHRVEGWETMDISPVYSPDFAHDMMRLPWPFDDETFTELKCFHVLEHLPATTMEIDWDNRSVVYSNTLVNVMNEMWRILKPDGVLEAEVPIFPFWTAIADPTHVSPPFVPQTFSYFCTKESYRTAMRGASVADDHQAHRDLYGIKTWELLKAFRDEMGSILKVRMKRA